MSFLMMSFAKSYNFWYVLFHINLVFVVASFHNGLHTSAVDCENLPR